MTRDFNKQRRNDPRPPFRKPSPGRYGEERAPRPARPRLNREIVDRAWESGAPQNHADYRSRGNTSNGQAPRNGQRTYRDGQRADHPSQHGHSGNKPYGNRSDNYRDRDNDRYGRRSSDDYQDRRSRSFDSDRRSSQDQRFGERRGYSDRPSGTNGANRANNVRSYQNYRDNAPSRGTDGRNRDRNWDAPRRETEHDQRGFRRYGSNRDDRPSRGYQGPQQRPYSQERPSPRRYNDALYEGDYEGVGQEQDARSGRTERPPRDTYRSNNKPDAEERHVTRLPDGRVLKGPRPVQRKNAAFWNEIAEDTDDLLNQVHVPGSATDESEPEEHDSAAEEPITLETAEEYATGTEGKGTGPARKPRTRIASAASRSKKAAAKPRSSGPKPSQRGFRWPTE